MKRKFDEILELAIDPVPHDAESELVKTCVKAVSGDEPSHDDFAVSARSGDIEIIVLFSRNHFSNFMAVAIGSASASMQGDDVVIGPAATPVVLADFGYGAPAPGIALQKLAKTLDPTEIIQLAKTIVGKSTPTVANGTTEIFVEAYRALTYEAIAIDRSHDITGDSYCAWPLDSNVNVPNEFDPRKPLLRFVKPRYFIESIRNASPITIRKRPATVVEFILAIGQVQLSAHDKLAAENLLREAAAAAIGEPALRHPAWRKFLTVKP